MWPSQLCQHHRAQRCRDLASSWSARSQGDFLLPRFPSRLDRSEASLPAGFAYGVQFRAASASLESNSATAERSFFFGSFSLSLAEPPTGAPLRVRGAFGSSLKGIPPTVPSPRSAPPPRDERAIPLLTKTKRN
jgi:hypothetical protein